MLKSWVDILVQVDLQRNLREGWTKRKLKEMNRSSIHALRFPEAKEEAWWLVIGDPEADSLLAIKRISIA